MEPAGQLPRHCGREATRPRRGAECPEAQISCLILPLIKKRVADPVREEARKGPPSSPDAASPSGDQNDAAPLDIRSVPYIFAR